jgi:DNA-binding LytR/AlgR family response regulator
MKCIIIEDEPAAQLIMKSNIVNCPGLVCCGIFGNAFEAQAYIDQNEVDLMFLDINLPEMSGVSFLRTLLHPPLVIFTTAYPQYAIDGFDLEIVDFLLKPFSFERFCKAVNKAKEKLAKMDKSPHSVKITVKADKRIYQIGINDIYYIESCGDYVTIYLFDKKLVVHGTIKSWEEKLAPFGFVKVHRTSIVNMQKIDHIEGKMINSGNYKIQLAEPFKSQLISLMMQ